jgi:hypothetical protein
MRVIACALATVAVLAAAACSSTIDSDGSFGQPACEGSKAVRPDGAGFCYLRPNGTRKPKSVTFASHKYISGAFLDRNDGVIVGLLASDPSYNRLGDDSLLEQINEEIESATGEITFDTGSGRLTKAPAGRVIGYNAKQGDDPVAVNLVFIKDQIIQVNCKWKNAGKKTAVLNACSSVLATIRAA